MGAPKPGLFQTWLFAIFTRKRSFALICALLRSFAPFALFAYLGLHSFACFCALLRVSASDRVLNNRVWELQNCAWATLTSLERYRGTSLGSHNWRMFRPNRLTAAGGGGGAEAKALAAIRKFEKAVYQDRGYTCPVGAPYLRPKTQTSLISVF